MGQDKGYIGITCAYSPLPLIDAAGFTPYRVLPIGDWPDQAGRVLHDNLCHHVKRVLDRAMEDDLPELDGMIFMNSCDAMRRLADAWRKERPEDNTLVLDLPVNASELNIKYFKNELEGLADKLTQWGGNRITDDALESSIESYNEFTEIINKVRMGISGKTINGNRERMQSLYNLSITETIDESIICLKKILREKNNNPETNDTLPVYLFGNIMPDPDVFKLFSSCGADIINDDLCTGSRMFNKIETQNKNNSPFEKLARGLLTKPECARTIICDSPVKMAENILSAVKESNALGVIGHTVKFCDPYLHRVPIIRETLKEAGIPFLFIEGDCTLRSMGQHRTRIEAFIEMLR